MLLASLLLFAAAVVVYVTVPSLFIYTNYPLPVYVLLLASVATAVASRRRGALRWVTIGLTGTITAFFVWYTLIFSQLDRGRITVHPGDPFPDFTLQTSTGTPFSPSQLRGRKAALYIFYRGGW
jgi:cytochrome oxidase Cu insertion factor (SCO1/SenC/PrrC family)